MPEFSVYHRFKTRGHVARKPGERISKQPHTVRFWQYSPRPVWQCCDVITFPTFTFRYFQPRQRSSCSLDNNGFAGEMICSKKDLSTASTQQRYPQRSRSNMEETFRQILLVDMGCEVGGAEYSHAKTVSGILCEVFT